MYCGKDMAYNLEHQNIGKDMAYNLEHQNIGKDMAYNLEQQNIPNYLQCKQATFHSLA
jgi:hypothetical protein